MLHEADEATTLGQEGTTWNLQPSVAADYRIPAWANDVPGFDADVERLDRADGRRDGRWGDDDISQLLGGWDTPARIPYQTRVVEELIDREGFGADDVPDLLFVNYKVTDYVAHTWGISSPEMRDSLVAQDAALRDLVDALDARVGAGRWALVLTADHGAAPSPSETGGTVISSARLTDAIENAFDTDGDDTSVVDLVQATEIYLNTDELAANGHDLDEVARFVAGLTAGEVAAPGQATPPDQRVFRAAYPSSVLADLPCLSGGRVRRRTGAPVCWGRPRWPSWRRACRRLRRAPPPTSPRWRARCRATSWSGCCAAPSPSAPARSWWCRGSRTSSARTSRTRGHGTTCRTSLCSGTARAT